MNTEEKEEKAKGGLNISARSFLTAILIIFGLMIAAYVLTFVVEGGVYTDGVYTPVAGGIPFWKWILSPILLLGSGNGLTVMEVIAFLLVIGGVFNSLGESGLMLYMLHRLTARFGKTRYRFLAAVIFFFMAMGTLIGSFEECVPLVPIVTSLTTALGFDVLTGLAVSLLAVGCGFAAGVCNPFTVGLAQTEVGLPVFSGMWLRALAFVLIYAILTLFVLRHAKKVARPIAETAFEGGTEKDKKSAAGLYTFAAILGASILLILVSALPIPFMKPIQKYSMVVVAVAFLAAGIAAVLVAGKGGKFLGKTFLSGLVSMLPAVLMVLMASSIRYILEEGKILDSLLHMAIASTENASPYVVILVIYLIVLVMNFFIASGSAKAVMLMPLIAPLAAAFGIPAQLTVVAFAFGDGFSNVFYPTNPVLLISLGLTDTSYAEWAKWTGKFQLLNLALTAGLLVFGLAVGYC